MLCVFVDPSLPSLWRNFGLLSATFEGFQADSIVDFTSHIMKLAGSPQSHAVCLQAHNNERPEPCESLTVVQKAPGDLVTVWNSQLNVCQLDTVSYNY